MIPDTNRPQETPMNIFTQSPTQFTNTPLFGDFMIVPPKDVLLKKQDDKAKILENVRVSESSKTSSLQKHKLGSSLEARTSSRRRQVADLKGKLSSKMKEPEKSNINIKKPSWLKAREAQTLSSNDEHKEKSSSRDIQLDTEQGEEVTDIDEEDVSLSHHKKKSVSKKDESKDKIEIEVTKNGEQKKERVRKPGPKSRTRRGASSRSESENSIAAETKLPQTKTTAPRSRTQVHKDSTSSVSTTTSDEPVETEARARRSQRSTSKNVALKVTAVESSSEETKKNIADKRLEENVFSIALDDISGDASSKITVRKRSRGRPRSQSAVNVIEKSREKDASIKKEELNVETTRLRRRSRSVVKNPSTIGKSFDEEKTSNTRDRSRSRVSTTVNLDDPASRVTRRRKTINQGKLSYF